MAYRNETYLLNKWHTEKASKPLTNEQRQSIEQFYNALKEKQGKNLSYKGARNYMIAKAELNLCYRISDIVKLKIKDVIKQPSKNHYGDSFEDLYDFDIDDIEIKDTISIVEQKTKKKGDREISEEFKRDLKSYLQCRRWKERFTSMNDYLFQSQKGQHITAKSAIRIITNASKKIGWKITTHSLRKTYGTMRLEKVIKNPIDYNNTLIELMVIYGHTNTEITKRYLYIHDNEIKKLMKNSEFYL